MPLHTPYGYPRNIPLGAVLGLPPVPLDVRATMPLYVVERRFPPFLYPRRPYVTPPQTIRACPI